MALQASLRSKQLSTYKKNNTARVKETAKPARKITDPTLLRKKYAGILGVSQARINNIALYQFIERWYGTPYRSGGCDTRGIDCSGFVQKLYTDVYKTDVVRTALQQFMNCKRFKRSADAIEGDLVFFSIGSRNITHVGVYLANDHFVHASTSAGVMISSLREDYWQKYFVGCGRVPKG